MAKGISQDEGFNEKQLTKMMSNDEVDITQLSLLKLLITRLRDSNEIAWKAFKWLDVGGKNVWKWQYNMPDPKSSR